ncbi:unnamed protein product, partial [Schistosoma intercalatum]
MVMGFCGIAEFFVVSCVHDGDQSYLLSGGFGQCSWILVWKFQFQIFVPVR